MNIKSKACSDSFNQGSVCNAMACHLSATSQSQRSTNQPVTGLSWSWFVDLKSSQSLLWESVQLWIWWLEIYHRQGSEGRYKLSLDGSSSGLTVPGWLILENFRSSFRSLIPGIKIRGFLGDYCIRTRCPTIKTRHVELLFIYSTFCSTLCVLTLCCIGWVGNL